jgi:hypothetical protein
MKELSRKIENKKEGEFSPITFDIEAPNVYLLSSPDLQYWREILKNKWRKEGDVVAVFESAREKRSFVIK